MAETKEKAEIKDATTYRFEDVDDTTVNISIIGSNGSNPYQMTLTGVTWGMMEDITKVQSVADEGPQAIFDFLNEHIEGGTRAVPLKYTTPLFGAIAEYMAEVMNTQKN